MGNFDCCLVCCSHVYTHIYGFMDFIYQTFDSSVQLVQSSTKLHNLPLLI